MHINFEDCPRKRLAAYNKQTKCFYNERINHSVTVFFSFSLLLSADHGLSRIRKSNKAFQPHTCITPHSLTPDSLNKEAAILSSSRLYQDRVINERHKNIISPEMEDVATAKYLNEKDIFDLRYDTSSKSVEGQVLDCLFIYFDYSFNHSRWKHLAGYRI